MFFVPLIAVGIGLAFEALTEHEREVAARKQQALLAQLEWERRERARQAALAELAVKFRATATHAGQLQLAADEAVMRAEAMAHTRQQVDGALRFHTWWRTLCVPISKLNEERRTQRTLLATQAACAVHGASAAQELREYEAAHRRMMGQLERLRAEAQKLGGQLDLPRGR